MKKIKKIMLWTIIIIAGIWTLLTLFVEITGPKKLSLFGNENNVLKAIIVYDPDPFYNLDQQVCESFAKALAAKGWFVQVLSVKAAKEIKVVQCNLYVCCANTYNWAPDWAITGFIKKNINFKNQNVVAITLGGGSTERSQKIFENLIKEQGANLLASKTWWLWRPNDKTRLKESNTKVTVEMAAKFGEEIADKYFAVNK